MSSPGDKHPRDSGQEAYFQMLSPRAQKRLQEIKESLTLPDLVSPFLDEDRDAGPFQDWESAYDIKDIPDPDTDVYYMNLETGEQGIVPATGGIHSSDFNSDNFIQLIDDSDAMQEEKKGYLGPESEIISSELDAILKEIEKVPVPLSKDYIPKDLLDRSIQHYKNKRVGKSFREKLSKFKPLYDPSKLVQTYLKFTKLPEDVADVIVNDYTRAVEKANSIHKDFKYWESQLALANAEVDRLRLIMDKAIVRASFKPESATKYADMKKLKGKTREEFIQYWNRRELDHYAQYNEPYTRERLNLHQNLLKQDIEKALSQTYRMYYKNPDQMRSNLIREYNKVKNWLYEEHRKSIWPWINIYTQAAKDGVVPDDKYSLNLRRYMDNFN